MIPLTFEGTICVNYDDLVIHEEMGEKHIIISKLKKKYTVKELLEGIEEKLNKVSLKKLVGEGEIKTVFKEISKYYEANNEVIAQLGRLSDLNKKIRLGIIKEKYIDEEKNKLRIALLELIDELG